MLVLDENGRAAQNILRVVPLAARDIHHHETTQQPQQPVDKNVWLFYCTTRPVTILMQLNRNIVYKCVLLSHKMTLTNLGI